MANIRFIETNPAAQAYEQGMNSTLQRERAEFDLNRQMSNQRVQESVDAATRAGLRNVLGRSTPEAPILSAGPKAGQASHGATANINPETGGRSHQQPAAGPPVGMPTPITPTAPMMTDRGAPGGATVQRPDSAPVVPRIGGGRRDMTPVANELVNVPGGGQAALRVLQQDDAARDRAQQRALSALARGDTATFQVLARDAGMQLPPQIANDAGKSALFARGALEARRIYGARGGRQSAAFVAEYIRNGGDPAAAFQAANAAPAAAGGGRRASGSRESVGMNRYKLAQQRAREKAAAEGREPTTQDTMDALREIGQAQRRQPGEAAPARTAGARPAPAAATPPAPAAPSLKTPDGRPAYGTYNPDGTISAFPIAP